jgi:multidrug resistance efflux pump
LAIFRAEMDLLRLNREPLTARQRADIDYEGLRLDWLSLRAEQAVTRILHTRAQQQYRRARQLYERELISADELEAPQAAWAALAVELRERESNIADLEARLERLAWPELDSEALMQSALNLHQQRLRALELELEPVIVRAPMDGIAGPWQRRPGEVIATGEELMAVLSETADHVVAYVRQPVRTRPEPATQVVIQTANRQRGVGRVTYMAPHLVSLPEHMSPIGGRAEMALQLFISIPEGMSVQPGELVDLQLASRPL